MADSSWWLNDRGNDSCPCHAVMCCQSEQVAGGGPEVARDPCTWPNTDCYVNGPGLADDEQPVNPRWRDCHELPDAWLIRHLPRRWLKRRSPRLNRLIATYALRNIHCMSDGQCVLRAGHRGGCTWGDDDE